MSGEFSKLPGRIKPFKRDARSFYFVAELSFFLLLFFFFLLVPPATTNKRKRTGKDSKAARCATPAVNGERSWPRGAIVIVAINVRK